MLAPHDDLSHPNLKFPPRSDHHAMNSGAHVNPVLRDLEMDIRLVGKATFKTQSHQMHVNKLLARHTTYIYSRWFILMPEITALGRLNTSRCDDSFKALNSRGPAGYAFSRSRISPDQPWEARLLF